MSNKPKPELLKLPEDPEAEYSRTLWAVRRTLPRSFDSEDIAVEILIESWSKGVLQPSLEFVRQRCIDKLRSRKRETKYQALVRATQHHVAPPEVEQKDEVEVLVKVLTPLERKIIWYRYYLGISVRETAEKIRLPVNRVSRGLEMALFKMREAGVDDE